MIFAAAIFLSACNKNDELLEKLNDNVGLVKKYNEFKSQGVEKEIDFNANIIDNVKL